jgi:hypothetical protein
MPGKDSKLNNDLNEDKIVSSGIFWEWMPNI